MRVLIVHDRYRDDFPNGENTMVRWETESLEAAGVATHVLETPASAFEQPLWKRGLIHLNGIYSIPNRRRVAEAIAAFRPDLVHVHNVWPHMTPAVYFSAGHARLPVVQTLHNYRLLCVNDLLCRDGKHCELCLHKTFAWPGLRHRCVCGSTVLSLAKVVGVGVHKAWGTWRDHVDVFIATAESMRAKFIEAGFAPEKIVVKPSTSPDPGVSHRPREYFCFAGRLNQEKGVHLLLEAWKQPGLPELRIAGAGDLEPQVRAAAASNPSIKYLGMLSVDGVFDLMGGAIATILPSTWDEPSPVVLMQSISVGTPVIASDLGSRAETVSHGEDGLTFPDQDIGELGRLAGWAAAHPADCRRMGLAARRRFEERYSLGAGRKRLLEIYRSVLGRPPSDRAGAGRGKPQVE